MIRHRRGYFGEASFMMLRKCLCLFAHADESTERADHSQDAGNIALVEGMHSNAGSNEIGSERPASPADSLAANSQETASKGRGRGFGRPFVPGQSGNPSGRPKDVLELQRFAREFGTEAIEKLRVMREAQSENAQANAAVAILDRGCGKPTQPTEGRHDVTYIVRDEPMPLDEWRKRFTEQ
jgi:Family of unknown function (DUF5681)